MPRHKSAPTRRCVHQFHEASAEPQITESCDTEQVNGSDDEDSSDEGSFDESFFHPDNSWLGRETLTPIWSTWQNGRNEGQINLCRTDVLCCPHTDQYDLFLTRVKVRLDVSHLEELKHAGQLSIFSHSGRSLIIESANISSSENFSCHALYPPGLIRGLKRDVDAGVLGLWIMGYDFTGFRIVASVACKQGSVTNLTPIVLKWLLESSITPGDDEIHNLSASSSSVYHPFPACPSWFTPVKAVFESDSFLEAASSSLLISSNSQGSEADKQSLLADELRKGGLTTELRPYQLKGVQWLYDTLDKSHPESDSKKKMNHFLEESSLLTGRHDGWLLLKARKKYQPSDAANCDEHICLWYNLMTEELTNILPTLPLSVDKSAVLADEMGIGKSIQVLSLVLLIKLRKLAQQRPRDISMSQAGVTMDQGDVIENDALSNCPPELPQLSEPSSGIAADEDDDTSVEMVVEQTEQTSKKRKMSMTAATIHKAMAAKAKKNAKSPEFPCLCGRRDEKKGDLGWVECSDCRRWLHVRCCGFKDADEAKSQRSFMCLACSCLRYGGSVSSIGRGTETEGIALDDEGRIRSDATLIIMPSTLIAQWRSEIAKHIAGSFSLFDSVSVSTPTTPSDLATPDDLNHPSAGCALRVFLFEGCEEATLRSKGLSFSNVDPRYLANNYDIIIMSLKTLTRDFHKTIVPEGVEPRVLRNRKSSASSDASAAGVAHEVDSKKARKVYISFPPPIMCIRFAMVVVDETQKIESEGMPQGLHLCTRIAADRRLCVTGTPLGHNRLSDLHSLCQFLQLPPYAYATHTEWLRVFGESCAFTSILNPQILRDEKLRNQWLANLFSPIMLRRTKNMLGDQLGLLPTVTTITMLTFSGFEAALYSERRRSIAKEVSVLIEDSDIGDAKMKLEVLRKGCCHPQVWDKDLSRRKGTGQGLVARPFEEIMILKVEKSRLECEERQRELVYHLNSLAGVAVLQAQLLITGQARAQAQGHAHVLSDTHSSEVYSDAEWDTESNGFEVTKSPGGSQLNQLCAADHLTRALRAYAYAYSFLERNRQTCPVLGLVRVSGAPEGSFLVHRVRRDEEYVEQDGSDVQENLMNIELRADKLSFSWSGTGSRRTQLLAGATDNAVIITEGPAILLDAARSSTSIRVEGRKGTACETANVKNTASSTAQPSLNAFTGVPPVSVHSLNLFSSERSKDMSACAKMNFNAGRRLQQLKIQTKLPSLIAEMRANMRRRGVEEERVILLFPQRVSLLAASGTADAFTRVAYFDLALPSLTPSPDASTPINDGILPLKSLSTFSDETVRDFSLSFRARSWKLDVLSVHGVCLEVKLSTSKQKSSSHAEKALSHADMDIEEDGDSHRASAVVGEQDVNMTGQWKRTLDCVSPLHSSAIVRDTSLHMSIGVDLFEATFDVDTFQELHVCANIPLIADMLRGEKRANNGRANSTNGQDRRDGVSDQIDDFVATIEFEKLISIPSHLPSPAVSPHASSVSVHPLSGDYQPNNTSDVSTSSTLCNTEMSVEQGVDCETPALFHSPSTSAAKPLLPKSLFPAQQVNERMLIQGGAGSAKKTKKEKENIALSATSSTFTSSTSTTTCTVVPCTSLLLETIRKRASQIEKDFVAGAKAMCASAQLKMEETITASNRCEEDVILALDSNADTSISSIHSSVHRKWWIPLLLRMEGERGLASLLALQCTIDQGQDAYTRFKHCTNVRGLIMLVGVEFEELETARSKAIQSLRQLSSMPTTNEILRASDCQRCRVYFKKTGPVCAHCHLEDVIVAYRLKLIAFKSKRKVLVSLARPGAATAGVVVPGKGNKKGASKDKEREKRASAGHVLGHGGVEDEGEVQAQEFNSEQVDGAFSMTVKHIRAYAVRHAVSRGSSDTGPLDDGMMLKNAAIAECRRCEGLWKELLAMTGLWQRYMSLLKVHDEVDQGKRRIGLNDYESSNGDTMSDNNLYPFELSPRYNEDYIHAVDKSCALKQSIGQLNFYKNQESEARERLAVVQRQRQRFLKGKQRKEDGRGVEGGSSSNGSRDKEAATAESRDKTGGVEESSSSRSGNDGLTCVFCQEDLCSSPIPSSTSNDSELSTSHDVNATATATATATARAVAPIVEPVVCLPCAHSFHRGCVKRWLQLHRACPICKSIAVLDSCVTVDTTDRRSSVSPRKVSHPSNSSGIINVDSDSAGVEEAPEQELGLLMGEGTDVEVKGQWGCKIDALVHDLLRLLLKSGSRGDGDKAIVFSQWPEMIDIVGEALTANNILFSICVNRGKDFEDGGTLERFKSDIDIRVLLMPLHLGAEGLDLIQASHIFLLEPLLNPALESQAVNRIHRIGQSKKTHVHKFAVKDTVEELILNGQQLVVHKEQETPEGAKKSRKSKVTNQKDQDFLTLKYMRFLLGVSESVA